MNKSNLKTFLYTALICIIVFGVIKLFFVALPYLVMAGILTWIGVKVYSFFKSKKSNVTSKENYESTTTKVDDNKDGFDTSKAIDVDFKDID
jgi:hypothetical protein